MDVEYSEEYIRNSRGTKLFTCKWLPLSSPKALVFLCHGYGMECSDFMKDYLVQKAMNKHVQLYTPEECIVNLQSALMSFYNGHYNAYNQVVGQGWQTMAMLLLELITKGMDDPWDRCYIKKFENIVNDCSDFFKSVCGKENYRDKKRFLYGESMGGAVALLIHKKDPAFWHDALLVAPMCKISEKVKPHQVVINILTTVEDIIPKWKIVPTKDVINAAFKDPIKRKEIRGNRLIYQDKPRLKTALEMLRTSMNLEDSLSQIQSVTDPDVSRALYERASSIDKTIKLYPGMWHALTSGEPDSNIEAVFKDITTWLDKRCEDDSIITLAKTPLHDCSPVIGNVGTAKLVKPQKKRFGGRRINLCGWKRSQMHRHFAM